MLLSAEKISKSYSEKALLSDVSLHIDKGDKIGMIGTNGTGKVDLFTDSGAARRAGTGER